MPYFTAEHVSISLAYLAENTHPSLVTFLAMIRAGVPRQVGGVAGVPFGSVQENDVLDNFFTAPGGTQDRPYYVPFGPTRANISRWKPYDVAGKGNQRMRTDRPYIYLRDEAQWWMPDDLDGVLAANHQKVVGVRPLSIHHLAVWCLREQEVADHARAITAFRQELNLDHYGLVPNSFSPALQPALSAIQLGLQPLGNAVAALLQPQLPDVNVLIADEDEAAVEVQDDPGPIAGGSWDISADALATHAGHLKGVDEAVLQAVAALRAGMHVVFTGPPGCGKTDLAQRLYEAGGFRPKQVTATDQWGTFETIGGYFPDPDQGGQVLEFLAGVVVETIREDRPLIIDEVNRADIDKAFGELFTLLSGHPVDLPFRTANADGGGRSRIRLAYGEQPAEVGTTVIRVPQSWRLIGAMNDADKASLKRLSYAFVRRFAFVPVPVPKMADYDALLDGAAGPALVNEHGAFVDALKALFANEAGLASIKMPMGFAIPKAMILHASTEAAVPGRATTAILRSCLELYLAPQFQGRADRHPDLISLVTPHLPALDVEQFERTLRIWTGRR